MKKDLYGLVKTPTKSIDVAATTATVNGASIDLKGFRSAIVVFDCDAYTDGTVTLKLQESSDDSAWSDVATADLVGGALPVIDGDNDDQAHIRGYAGNNRYIRANITVAAGATSGAIIGAMLLPGHKMNDGKLSS